MTMTLTGAAKGIKELKDHAGWRLNNMPARYARMSGVQDLEVSSRLRSAIDGEGSTPTRAVEGQFRNYAYEELEQGF